MHDVGINPRRAGLLDVLERMGVRVGVLNKRRIAGELVGDVEVTGTHELVPTWVGAEEVPRLVDELPLVALLGAFAHGQTRVSGAEELRTKESDRSRPSPPRCVRSGCGSSRSTTASSSAARPRGRGAGRSTPRATTGSRCSAPSPGSSPAKGCGSKGPSPFRSVSPASSTCFKLSQQIVTIWPRGGRQEHRRARAREAARLPLPRHGCDVPQPHRACAQAGRAVWRRRSARSSRRRDTQSPSIPKGASSSTTLM